MNPTFEERFTAILKLTQEKYEANHIPFVIEIVEDDLVHFQLIASKMLEGKSENTFGYAIHLTFDSSFPGAKEELERFLTSDVADSFTENNRNGIPTYQLDVGNDDTYIIPVTKLILEQVFNVPAERVFLDEFEA